LPDSDITKNPNFNRILEVEKTRLTTLLDIEKDTGFFISLPQYNPEMLIFKKSTKEDTIEGLSEVLRYFKVAKWPETVEGFNNALAEIVEKGKLGNGDLYWPARVALSGAEKSASPAELLWVLGKEEATERISLALSSLK
jgi:glutamyl/glutaminyl-tRNA synthetase